MTGRVSELSLLLTLVGSGGAILFPDLVRAEAVIGGSLLDRGTVRLFAIPLFLASAALLLDLNFHWSKGLI